MVARCVATLEGHRAHVTSLVALGDAGVASASTDNTIKFWAALR